jgi:hypothetical protein
MSEFCYHGFRKDCCDACVAEKALQSSREDAERLAEALKNLRVYGCSGFAGIRAEANALADEALAAHDKVNS